MPSSETAGYCYCSRCVDTPDGFTLQLRRTRYNHDRADRLKELTGEHNSVQAEAVEQADGEQDEDSMGPGEGSLANLFEDAEYGDQDGDDDDDESDDLNEPTEHQSDYSMSESDELWPLPEAEDFDLSDSDNELPSPPNNDYDQQDILDDPLFLRRGLIPYDDGDEDGGDDEEDDNHQPPDLPPAFQEHPAIRNAYIRAFIMGSLKGSTHAAIQMHLEGVAIGLRAAVSQSDQVQFPGLENMARTLSTAEKRLGVSTEQFITYYFLCDICWTPYHPSRLTKLLNATCEKDGCSGTLFTTKRLSKGEIKRTPLKILPYVPLQKAVQHILMRPGKFDQLQHWRGPADAPGIEPPLSTRGIEAFGDPERPMTDIYDGWGWRAIQAGLERRRGGPWTIRDVDVNNLLQRFVSLPLGLVWQMNIDW